MTQQERNKYAQQDKLRAQPTHRRENMVTKNYNLKIPQKSLNRIVVTTVRQFYGHLSGPVNS